MKRQRLPTKINNSVHTQGAPDDAFHDISEVYALNGSLSINPYYDQRKKNCLRCVREHVRANYSTYFIAAILMITVVLLVQLLTNYLYIREHSSYFERNIEKLDAQITFDESKQTKRPQFFQKMEVQLPKNEKLSKSIYSRKESTKYIPKFNQIQQVAQFPQKSMQTINKPSQMSEDQTPFDLENPKQQNQEVQDYEYLRSSSQFKHIESNTPPFERNSNKAKGVISNSNLQQIEQAQQSSISKKQQQLQINFVNIHTPFRIEDQVIQQLNQSILLPKSPTKIYTEFNTDPSIHSNIIASSKPVFYISNFTGINIAQKVQSVNWLQLNSLDIQSTNQLAEQERNYYEEKYHVGKYSQLPFCIVVPSYNNVANGRHFKNIRSVVMQEYINYHLVFIDDSSTDGTGFQVSEFMKQQTKLKENQWIVIRNTKQLHALPNLIMAASNYCQAEDIFLIVDGDDELIGRQVLKFYNSIFQDQGVWFVYSNFLSPKGQIGYSRPFPEEIIHDNQYRIYPFVTSHLRAFYTQLFRNIKDKDLKDIDGNYFKAANDVAICLPILEQAQDRVAYIPQLTYLYNIDTGMNNHIVRLKEQKENDFLLRDRSPYSRIATLYDKQ